MNDPSALRASLLEVAGALGPTIRSAAAEIERQRSLPKEIVDRLAEAGTFRMGVPRAVGGGEVDPLTQLEVIEALSKADASTGWCAMIAAGAGAAASSLLPEDVARGIWQDPKAIIAGVFAPSGIALDTGDGYRVSGRWRFASFCQHATWLTVNTFCAGPDGMKLGPDGKPETRTFIFKREDVEIVDAWNVMGMRGTGSHDLALNDAFAPANRSYSILGTTTHPGPLYSLRPMFLLPQAIVALAVGQSVLDAIAGRKDRPPPPAITREQVAKAAALLGAGRAFLFDVVRELWESLVAGKPASLKQRGLFRLAFTNASTVSMQAMDLLFSANGGGSIYQADPIERAYRDVRTMTTHGIGSLATYEAIGAMLLGRDAPGTMFGPIATRAS